MGTIKYWLSKLRESAVSTAPIALVVVALFFVMRYALPADTFQERFMITNDEMYLFGIAVAMIVIGMTLFNAGTEESMTEIGHVIGGSLVKKKNLFFVIAMTFILGVLVTIAEPDLTVLSSQIGIHPQLIIWTIGVGVGTFLVVGILRVTFNKNLKLMFLGFYALAFTLIYIIDPRFLPICFDSGGVTTGPVTVPFLLGFGAGMAASHHGKNSEDSFGLTALCSVGPILSVIIIAIIMKGMGKGLPLMEDFVDPLSSMPADIWSGLLSSLMHTLVSVAISVGPLLGFFLIYELIFVRLPWKSILRIFIGMLFTYAGLVCFLTAVEAGFLPIASKLGQALGSKTDFFPIALGLGAVFGVFGVLAEPAVHVLVAQIESISDGAIKGRKVLFVLAFSIGAAVALHLVRAYFQFDLAYYIIPGYILVFVLSFLVPNIYTAMAFDSGGVASGPMTSTFVLPFCIGFAYSRYVADPSGGGDVYLYGFGLVAMVAMMPLIVLQTMGLSSQINSKLALYHAKRRLVEENDDQIVHFKMGGEFE